MFWKGVKLSLAALCTILLIITQTACIEGREPPSITTIIPITPQLTPEPEVDLPKINITGVEVQEGELIAFSGETSLPQGECLNSKLTQDGTLLDWWPVDQCFPLEAPDWRISVALGSSDRPKNLDSNAQYRLKVWWSSAPETVVDVFYFDLTPPPSP